MKFFFTMVFALIAGLVLSQNLVVNPGFEDCEEKQTLLNQPPHYREINKTKVAGWSDPTYSSDLYCMPPDKSSDLDIIPQPDLGSCFCGGWICTNGCGVTEFVEGTLSEPLEKGQTYRFSVSIARRPGTTDEHVPFLGVYFSDSLLKLSANNMELLYTPQLKLMPDKKMSSSTRWVSYYGYFRVTTGGETHFIFGAFKDIKLPCIPNVSDRTYFYFDNFCVIETGADLALTDPLHNKLVKKNSTPALRNNSVYAMAFMFDSTGLLTQDRYSDLDNYVTGLKLNPKLTVEISCFEKKDGQYVLSAERAKLIAEYFIFCGIPQNRVSCPATDTSGKKITSPETIFRFREN